MCVGHSRDILKKSLDVASKKRTDPETSSGWQRIITDSSCWGTDSPFSQPERS